MLINILTCPNVLFRKDNSSLSSSKGADPLRFIPFQIPNGHVMVSGYCTHMSFHLSKNGLLLLLRAELRPCMYVAQHQPTIPVA